jgi:hypothetical protein
MRDSFLGCSTLLLAMSCASGLTGCSAVLDFDALTSGDGDGDGSDGGDTCVPGSPCPLWNVPCHSVFVPAEDETHAFVTRYRHEDGSPPAGLYRVDFSKSAADAATLLYKDDSKENGLPAAGIAGNESMLVFATYDPDGGGVRKLSLNAGADVTEVVDDAKNAFGVALAGDTFYWAHGAGVSRRLNGSGKETSWPFVGGGKYVAVDDAGTLYASTGKNANKKHDVLQLSPDDPMKVIPLFLDIADAGGVTVKRLPREGDGEPVPHIFVVTATGAKLKWLRADGSFTQRELGTNDQDADAEVAGEIATDATHVYWTMRADDAHRAGNVFRKVLTDVKPDTPAEIVAADHNNPNGIAITEQWVYWCSAEGLRRIEKKP